jgi:hypothetical protein
MNNLRCIKCPKDAIAVYRGYSLCKTHYNEQVIKDKENKTKVGEAEFHSIFETIFGK